MSKRTKIRRDTPTETATLRSSDMKGERIVKSFLLRHYYPRRQASGAYTSYEDIADLDRQIAGEDTIVQLPNGTARIIDEKCALHYINDDLPTFAFEVQYRNRAGELADGWFLDDALSTQEYDVMWITCRPKAIGGEPLTGKAYAKTLREEDITEIRLMQLDRQRLLGAVKRACGCTGDLRTFLMPHITALREEGERMRTKRWRYVGHVKLLYTPYLKEQPINLVLGRDTILHRSCTAEWLVKPEGVWPYAAVR